MPKEVDVGLKAVDRVHMAVHKVGHKKMEMGLRAVKGVYMAVHKVGHKEVDVEGGHKVGHKKVDGVDKVPKEVLLALNNQWAAWL